MRILLLLTFISTQVNAAFITPQQEAPVQTNLGRSQNGSVSSSSGNGGVSSFSAASSNSGNGISSLFDTTELLATDEAQGKNAISNLGPFRIGFEFCQQIQAIATILNVYSNVTWPVIGVPGFTFGLLQNDSALIELCDFIIRLDGLETEGAIYAIGAQLNKTTEGRTSAYISQADILWNTANVLYDFEVGGFKRGALTSAATHRQLLNASEESYKNVQRMTGTKEDNVQSFEREHDRKRDLQELADVAFERTIIEEALKCNQPDPSSEQQAKDNKKIPDAKNRLRQADRSVEKIREILLKMGVDMFLERDDLVKYRNRLNELESKGAGYQFKPKSYQLARFAPTGAVEKDQACIDQSKAAGGSVPCSKKPVVVDKGVTRYYQDISSTVDSSLWTKFLDEYEPVWESHATKLFYSEGGLTGLFTGKKKQINGQYASYSVECSSLELHDKVVRSKKNVIVDSPEYNNAIEAEGNACREKLYESEDLDSNTYNSFFAKYVGLYKKNLRRVKQNQAKIWTYDSKWGGIHPLPKELAKSGQQDKAEKEFLASLGKPRSTCNPEYTPAEMNQFRVNLANANVKTNELILKQQIKRNQIEEAKIDAEIANREERERQTKFQSKKNAVNSRLPQGRTPGVFIGDSIKKE